MTDGRGNVLADKRVDWVLVEGNGSLLTYSSVTDRSGYALSRINRGNTATVRAEATVYGYRSDPAEFRIRW